jgi:hypothetical protein
MPGVTASSIIPGPSLAASRSPREVMTRASAAIPFMLMLTGMPDAPVGCLMASLTSGQPG